MIQKSRAIESIKNSWKITKGNFGKLFFLWLLLAVINIISVLALFIGLLVTIPFSLLTLTFVYRKLEEPLEQLQIELENQQNI